MENGAYEDNENQEHCEPDETNAVFQSESSDEDSVQRGKVCARVIHKVEKRVVEKESKLFPNLYVFVCNVSSWGYKRWYKEKSGKWWAGRG